MYLMAHSQFGSVNMGLQVGLDRASRRVGSSSAHKCLAGVAVEMSELSQAGPPERSAIVTINSLC
jgi:hypothetical protein